MQFKTTQTTKLAVVNNTAMGQAAAFLERGIL
jgi:hypothetical protein